MQHTQICRVCAVTHCTLFSECTVSANGVKLSNTNGNYEHKAFIQTEFSSERTAKNTWLVCHGYYYEVEPAKIDGADNIATDVAARKTLVAHSGMFSPWKTAQ